MPCYDARDTDPQAAREEGRDQARRDAVHNSPPAELLCWVLGHMEEPTKRKFLVANPALSQWWSAHQERDRLKEINERAAQAKKIHNKRIDDQIKALQRKRK